VAGETAEISRVAAKQSEHRQRRNALSVEPHAKVLTLIAAAGISQLREAVRENSGVSRLDDDDDAVDE